MRSLLQWDGSLQKKLRFLGSMEAVIGCAFGMDHGCSVPLALGQP